MRGAVALIAAMLLLTACGPTLRNPFYRETGEITIPRQDFVNTWAVTKVLYSRLRAQAERYCQTRPPAEALRLDTLNCGELPEIDREARALAVSVDAKIAVPESEIDWATVKELLSLLVGLVP